MNHIEKAVVTGATGMIGTELIKQLLDLNIEVLAIVRPGTSKLDQLPYDQNLYLLEADLSQLWDLVSDIKTLCPENSTHFKIKWKIIPRVVEKNSVREYNAQRQCTGYNAFFHLGWANTFGKSRNLLKLQSDNIKDTLNAVDLAHCMGCEVFVGAGSQAEYGRAEYGQKLGPKTAAFPENGYGIAKLCAGQMSRTACKQLGIRHIWCRILSIYGPNDNPATMIMSGIKGMLDGQRPLYTAGEQLWDYLFVVDCARALYLGALNGKADAVYCIGSGSVKPIKDYILTLRNAIDPDAPIGIGEVPYAANQVMFLQADITNLSEDTGFKPKVSFEEGIEKTIKWYIDEKKVFSQKKEMER